MDYKYNSINELNHFDFAEASVGDIQMADNMFHMVIDNVKILPENSFNRDIRTMRTNEMLFKIEGAEVISVVEEGYNEYDADGNLKKKIADEIARVSVAFIQQKMDQDAPNIIQKGYSDGEPVSPSTMKNTVIGGILGMFLAIAVIVVAYLFNDTIMNADDVQRKLGLNVLGTLPLEEAEYDGEKERKRKRRKKKK